MSLKKLLLVGCGEHARMVIDNIEMQDEFTIVGLVDSDSDSVGEKVSGYEIVCTDDTIQDYLSENTDIEYYFLGLGVGNMGLRERVYLKMDKLLKAPNIIHPTAIISKSAMIGEGNLIEAYTKVANDTIMGSHNIINSFTSLNHDQFVGNNNLLGCSCSLAGKRIGDNSIISDGSSIGFKKSVGSNCIIGDGAVVTKDLPDGSIAYGNPAKVVRQNDKW